MYSFVVAAKFPIGPFFVPLRETVKCCSYNNDYDNICLRLLIKTVFIEVCFTDSCYLPTLQIFDSKDAAHHAVQSLHDSSFQGSRIQVEVGNRRIFCIS